RGIGADTARALARERAHVIVLDRPADEERARAVAAEVGGSVVLADVTDESVVAVVRAHLEGLRRRLDVLVHNAGVTRDKTLGRMDAAQWDLTLAINLGAIVRMTEGLDAALDDGGRIVLMSSIGGIAGNVGQTNYAASKSGVIGVARHLAPTLAARGVTVNAVAPGFIDTQMTAAMPAVTREVARRLSALSQGGLPIDIAEAVTFLASPGAQGLTGQVLRVCGGNFVGA
ncbi:MAG: SDR family oxidoreductase, partial [Deltaproteobacteria bacterium]